MFRGEDGYKSLKQRGLKRKSDIGCANPTNIENIPGYYYKKQRGMTDEEIWEEYQGWVNVSGTSIFDPVLCEIAYRWFCLPGGRVLDPFAGGSVRGIVATYLGRQYVGIDLSERQIEANEIQAEQIVPDNRPVWIVGDSRQLIKLNLGMSKAEVVSEIGKPVAARGSITNKHGQLVEVWEYAMWKGPAPVDYWLYFVDGEFATAIWAYSIDGDPSVPIPGYEIGVDVMAMCGLVGIDPENRLAVPVENMDGDDADILIVDIANGHLLAHAEDPIVNPGLLVIGFERGVDLVRWTDNELVAPLEARGFDPGLVVLDIDGAMVDSFFDANLLGFQRSVDPIVAPLAPPALIVPIQDEGFDTDVMVFTEPPNLDEGYRLENENPGLELGRFEVDVDLGLVDKTKWGELFICIPEEEPGGGDARLRFELTAGLPGDRVLAMVTRASGLLPSSFYLIDIPTGDIIIEKNDLLGLELGLDMVNGQGPVTPGELDRKSVV